MCDDISRGEEGEQWVREEVGEGEKRKGGGEERGGGAKGSREVGGGR